MVEVPSAEGASAAIVGLKTDPRQQGGSVDAPQRHEQDFGWWRCVAVAVGGGQMRHPGGSGSGGSGALELRVALYCLLPVPLRLGGGVRLTLEDKMGEWDIACGSADQDLNGGTAANGDGQREDDSMPGRDSCGGGDVSPSNGAGAGKLGRARGEAAGFEADLARRHPMVLHPGRWEHSSVHISPRWAGGVSFEIRCPREDDPLCLRIDDFSSSACCIPLDSMSAPRCAGRLHVTRVLLTLSDHCSVLFRASSFFAASPASSLPLAPSSSSSSLHSASLGALHSLLGLTEPFASSAAPDGGAWRMTLPHLGPLPLLHGFAPTASTSSSERAVGQQSGSSGQHGHAAAAEVRGVKSRGGGKD